MVPLLAHLAWRGTSSSGPCRHREPVPPSRSGRGRSIFREAVPALIVLAVAVLFVGLMELSVRRTWKNHKAIRDPVRGALTDDGFEVQSAVGSAKIPWDYFRKWSGSGRRPAPVSGRQLSQHLRQGALRHRGRLAARPGPGGREGTKEAERSRQANSVHCSPLARDLRRRCLPDDEVGPDHEDHCDSPARGGHREAPPKARRGARRGTRGSRGRRRTRVASRPARSAARILTWRWLPRRCQALPGRRVRAEECPRTAQPDPPISDPGCAEPGRSAATARALRSCSGVSRSRR